MKRGDGLDITYKNNKIKKVCTDAKNAEYFGDRGLSLNEEDNARR